MCDGYAAQSSHSTSLLLHAYSYTPTLTRILLHAFSTIILQDLITSWSGRRKRRRWRRHRRLREGCFDQQVSMTRRCCRQHLYSTRMSSSLPCVSFCAFVPVRQVNWVYLVILPERRGEEGSPACSAKCVSICTFVLQNASVFVLLY
jgi:hypothetical protein